MKILGVELENICESLDTALSRKNVKLLLPFAKQLMSYLEIVSQFREGLAWYERLARAGRELGDKPLLGYGLLGQGRFLWRLGNYAGVEKLYQESLQIKRDIGNREWIASTLVNIGALLVRRGANGEARERLLEVFGIMREIGLPNDAAWGMLVTASLLANTGSFAEAAVVLAGTKQLAQMQSYELDEGEAKLVEDGMAKLRAALSEDDLKALHVKGEAMQPDELSDFASSALVRLQATNYCE